MGSFVSTETVAQTLGGDTIKGAIITINIGPLKNNKGQLACALHDKADDFPMGFKGSNVQFHNITGEFGQCVFTNVSNGVYALAIIHDKNSDRKLNTNLVGMPKERWAVSNDVHPKMRAPKFEEAKFEVIDGEDMQFDLRPRK